MSEVAVITVPAKEWSEAMAMIKDTRDQVAKLYAKRILNDPGSAGTPIVE